QLKRHVESGGAISPSQAATAVQMTRVGRGGSRHRVWKLIAAVAAVVGIGIALFLYSRRAPAVTEKDTVLLADFDNRTGDDIFDDTLKQALSVDLEQSPYVTVLSDRKVARILKLMGRDPDQRVTGELARDVCQRAGSKVMLAGLIATLGNQYLIGLDALNCASGDTVAQELVQVRRKEDVLAAVGSSGTRLRKKLGESVGTIREFDTPLVQATTPSLDALRAFSLGRKMATVHADFAGAVPQFQRAIQLDPNFATAYASLSACYLDLGATEQAADSIRKAYGLRHRVSERERFYIESLYYLNFTGELEKARQIYELWGQTYPRDIVPSNNLAIIYGQLGQYDKDLTEALKRVELDPEGSLSRANLVYAYLYLNRFQEARDAAQDALAKGYDSTDLRLNLYTLAFLQNNSADMQQQVAWARGKPGAEEMLLLNEADTAGYFGKLRRARELEAQAVAVAERAGEKETAASFEADAGFREGLFGNSAEARHYADRALALSAGRDVRFGAAMALALGGDYARARTVEDDMNKRYPTDTVVQFNFLPSLRAQLAIAKGDVPAALTALQAAS